jgi:hypothetical protein
MCKFEKVLPNHLGERFQNTMSFKILHLLLLQVSIVMLFNGCARKDKPVSASVRDSLSQHIATSYSERFVGTLACTDCPGVSTDLSLFGNFPTGRHTFRLKQNHVKPDGRVVESTGRWSAQKGYDGDPDAAVYELKLDTSDVVYYFRVVDRNHLKLLDSLRHEIKSTEHLTLTHDAVAKRSR